VNQEPLLGLDLGPEEVVRRLRDRMIDQLARFLLIIGAFGVVLGVYNSLSRSLLPLAIVYAFTYLVILLVLRRGSAYVLRVAGMAGVFYAMGLIELLVWGWNPDASLFLVTFAVVCAIFYGEREGYGALALSVVTLGLLGGLQFFRPLGLGPDEWVGREIREGFNNLIIFSLVGLFLVRTGARLLTLLTDRLAEVMDQSERLAQEQEELDARAEALQKANYAMQRRTMHMEAGAEVARTIASIFNLERLLERTVRLVSDSFHFYHTGIFLVDDLGEVAFLKAASSTGGQRMVASGHHLSRGQGLVGWVLEHREPRIALDVESDERHYAAPMLPNTRSEVALPLITPQDEIIGVLDVQSTEEGAFDEDDVRSLQFLANQLAVSIENAQRLSEEAALLEAADPFSALTRRVTNARTDREVYSIIFDAVSDYAPYQALVVRFDRERRSGTLVAHMRGKDKVFSSLDLSQTDLGGEEPFVALGLGLRRSLFVEDVDALDDSVPAEYHEALRDLGESSGVRSLALIPIHRDGKGTSVLVLSYYTSHQFSLSEQQLYRALAGIANVSLSRTALIEEAERRLRREQVVTRAAARMRETLDVETVLSAAADELYETLGLEEVVVRLATNEEDAEA
jgi:transcriptional regulator with GAF, ATPase, and Fis domain